MARNQFLVISGILIAVIIVAFMATIWFGRYHGYYGWPSWMTGRMTGGMMGGGGMGQMRDMMHRMMPDLLPPGVEPENLPDPNSSGAKLLVRYCTQCHNLASPSMHTAEEWPVVANRMFRRMSRMSGMGMMNVGYPSSDEQQTIIAYLKAHSLRAISPGAIPSPETQGAVLYKNTCSQCHALPDPQLHTAKEWPAIVDKMLAYAQSMEKKGIVEREKKEILSYLARHARK